MADRQIFQLDEKTTPVATDWVAVQDKTGTAGAKKVSQTNLAKGLKVALQLTTPGGRLTLTTAVPVTTSDVSAATTVYYTPYVHNIIMLYSGTAWEAIEFTEVSIAVPSTTVTPFDVFGLSSGGSLVIETLDWTNDITRATALAYQDGRLVKSGSATRLYLGTGRTTGVSGQTEDSISKRFHWNYYNRVPRQLKLIEVTNHTYATNTVRPWNNATANRVELITGVSEALVIFTVAARIDPQADGNAGQVGIALNGTAAFGFSVILQNANVHAIRGGMNFNDIPIDGYSFYQALENAPNSANIDFNNLAVYGDYPG